MKQLLFIWLLLYPTIFCEAQTNYTTQDKEIFNTYLQVFQSKKELPLNAIIIETSQFFLGTPYVASTLEKEPEQLVVNFRELDCTTLVETTLALAKTIKSNNPSFETFCNNLTQIRYRDGKIIDYTSRKHYTSDWISENEKQGLIKDITQKTGGQPYATAVSFMSTHPEKYKQLAKTPSFVSFIENKEKEINARSYYYIPKHKIAAISHKIQNGDILCFTSTIKGLDISHVGYAYWKEGKLTFIHASVVQHKVIINPTPLTEYIAGIKHNSGIMLIRPL